MQKGELLEITLRIVQESLKEKDNTEIYSKYRIENNSGRKREFDIVIKSIVNGFELIVVIECKDYFNPVPVEKIEAFHSKCLRIPSINKKIFVSRNGFQLDALNAAIEFGIETYDIENIEKEIVSQWCAVSLVKPIVRYIRIERSGIWTKPPLENQNINLQSTIYHKNKKQGSTIEEFFFGLIKRTEVYPSKIFITREGEKIDKSETYSLEIDSIKGLFIKDADNAIYEVFKVHIIFTLEEKEVKESVKVERIKSKNKNMSTIITHDSEAPESIKLVLRDSDPNTFDAFLVNKETGKILDSGYTFSYRKNDEKK